MTPIELVKEYFPEATDDEADSILWSRTGFPSFFREDGSVEDNLRKQLSKYKTLVESGVDVCEMCNSEDVKEGLCMGCFKALKKDRNN